MPNEFNETVNILLAFGGSGCKTVAYLMEQMANDPQAARVAGSRVHIVLCDTDDGDLEESRNRIRAAFAATGLTEPPPIEVFRLADSVDLFQDLVSERMSAMSPESKAVIRQYWWFEPTRDGRSDRPFAATTMPENVNRGAAQCPLVSHFLAWDKLPEFERLLERISIHCRNQRNLENFSVDLFVIAGLAGGTGRGSWQTLAFKAREFFWQDKNGRHACRPIGFFFDWSCFSDIAAQRPEQAIKLQVNSYTGLSELSMWLRSALPADGVIANGDSGIARERAFQFPSLRAPADRSASAIDTDRYMPESDEARHGRTPIHRAYIFTKNSRSISLQTSLHAFELAAAAIYGRLCISQTRSADSNEPERACATATSILAVPIAKIRLAILREANAHRIRQLVHGESAQTHLPLTSMEGKNEIVVQDDDLKATLVGHENSLRKLLNLQNREQFAAFGSTSQCDLQNSMSVLAFAVSEMGEQAVVAAIENSESKARVLEELDRALNGVTSVVEASVATAFRTLVKDKGEVSGGAKREALERLRRVISDEFVMKPLQKALLQGIGPARAMARSLGRVAADAAKLIATAAAQQDDATVGVPKNGSDWAKKYFGFFGRVKPTQVDAFRATVRERLCARAYPAVAREMKSIVDAIREDIDSLDEMLKQAVSVLERERGRILQDSQKLKKECFTNLDIGSGRLDQQNKMFDRLKQDRATPVSKMIRTLRPIHEREEFERIVAQLAADSRAVQSARNDLGEFLKERIASHGRRTQRSNYEFTANLEERLKSLLERQSVEFRDLQEMFNMERVLEGLATAWFETYRERKGDAQFAEQFANEVEVLTGYDLREAFNGVGDRKGGAVASEDDLRPPAADKLLASVALRLASGCDPFVQYTNTGDRRDRATLIVPNSPLDPGAKKLIDLIVNLANDARNFAHVKAVASTENYFMLVATADLPKTNFADTGWDGWFSEPSDPNVRKWLDWCEDPQGIAPFKTADGSVGLGYICPKYVRDAHLSARRWKPWVKNDRGREQMHRKWVALAYALLGNRAYSTEVTADWSSRYNQFVDVFCATFGGTSPKEAARSADTTADIRSVLPNIDFPNELWTLPLIEERPGGRGPTFMRQLWISSTTQNLRLAGMEPKDFDDVTSSMRKFVNWFESEESDRAVFAILAEQALFANLLRKTKAFNDHIHAVTSVQHMEALRKFLREYASQWQTAIRNSMGGLSAEEKEKQVEFLERFIHFFDRGMPDLNLFEPFDGTRG